jgi:putative glutamine amidotransferase
MSTMGDERPLIGITADAVEERFQLSRHYVRMVADAGGAATILPADREAIPTYLARCDGFLLSGGDDPDMTRWGLPTHPKAKTIDPERQAFELALLDALGLEPRPVLGVCLGMQLMALHAGGTLDQHLPDTLATAADHWDRTEHAVEGPLGSGLVHSHHRQAITDAGWMRVVARARDGVIEAVDRPPDDGGPLYLGVQWHPERTADARLGRGIVRQLVEAARTSARRSLTEPMR